MTEVSGVSEPDYQVWKHHPVSKVFIGYLADYRTQLINELVARWTAGTLIHQDEQELRGRVMTLQELSDLPFVAIAQFYNASTEDGDAA